MSSSEMLGEPSVVAPDPGGRSALGEAVQLGLDIEGVQRQLSSLTQVLGELRQRQGRFLAGAEGEQRVVRVLVDMVDTGWTVLPDRRWPGTRAANIDVLLVGPGGVFVVDVKNWRDVQIADGRLWRGQEPADDATGNLLVQAAAVRAVLVEHGLVPAEVIPLLVLARRRNTRARLGDIHVLGELDLSLDLLRRGTRLSAAQVELVVAVLESACPLTARAHPRPEHQSRASTTATTRRPSKPGPTGQGVAALLDLEGVWAGLIEAASAEPIEAWMTWLHPSQARLISQTWNGPARVRGAAGTGKTVVALHRARHLAQHGRRVLFTSYVKTLGPVFAGLFTRLAPDLTDRVDFRSTHQVAMRLLRAAGGAVTIDQPGLDDCWNRAWAATHHDGILESVGQSLRYWHDEISHVIKGRGITAWPDYASLTRVGRHTPLQPAHRQAVWRLYEEYERRRTERGLVDWDDVLSRALDVVRDGVVATAPWDAVIVDEVQDVTCTGLRLLHALVGDRLDGLLRWHHTLATAGIPAVLLTDYDGRTVDAVKIGTFERGKGLDFVHVLIPDHDHIPASRRHHESTDAYAERADLERRRLYVAIVRARDTLWLGTTVGPTEVRG